MKTQLRVKPAFLGTAPMHRVAGGAILVLDTTLSSEGLQEFWAHPEFQEYLEEVPVTTEYKGVTPKSTTKEDGK